MPATHQPLRFTSFKRPASAKKFKAATLEFTFLFFMTLHRFMFRRFMISLLPDDFIGQDGRSLRGIKGHPFVRHWDRYLHVQVLSNHVPDPLLFRTDHKADGKRELGFINTLAFLG